MDVRDKAIQFEAKKVSMNQNKDGIILRLSIHPNDVPRQLWTDWVGTRYGVAMVRIGDDEQPEANEETERAVRAIKSAGMLCRNPAFQQWVYELGKSVDVSEEATTDALRQMLGIRSRSEFKEDPGAVAMFEDIKRSFLDWREQNPHAAKTERRDHDG